MGGGLLNLIAASNNNPILNGNPTKTFFKTTYAKYTNFGMQKFRVDYDGLRNLRLCEESKFTFKVPRYADLLLDTYLVISLPHIWSPIYPPETDKDEWRPYEFKWIEDLGTSIIQDVTIRVGGQIIQKYSGNYLHSIVNRDYQYEKKSIHNHMTGNINSLNDPSNIFSRVNTYPNAYYTGENGAIPSINERKLYIPLNPWYMLSNKLAFPLIALQYNELFIDITLRPINDLFRIRDVKDVENNYPYVRPNFNDEHMAMYRFLHAPPSERIYQEDYGDLRSLWNADIHLIATYGFISDEEARIFASNEHKYLFKQVYEYKFDNVTGSKKVELASGHLVSSWTFFFQRSDIKLRNEWTNYTNWPYKNQPPVFLFNSPIEGEYKYKDYGLVKDYPIEIAQPNGFGAGVNPDSTATPWMITGPYNPIYNSNILKNFGILLDGNYREDTFSHEIYQFIEKYAHSNSGFYEGVYYYNFCLNTDIFDSQPSGAIDMSKFQKIELELTTILPPLDEAAQTLTICDDNGEVIGVNKPTWNIFEYNYDLIVLEERYNILYFLGGNCGLIFSN